MFCEEQASAIQAAVSWNDYAEYSCSLARKWDEFASYVGEEITASEDGFWQPVTDERIRAVLPIAPDGAWLYGERGLAMADRPMLIIAPTDDESIPPTRSRLHTFSSMSEAPNGSWSHSSARHTCSYSNPR